MPWRETEHRDFRGGENLADNAKTLRPNEIVLGENVVITGHAQAQKRLGMTQMFTSAQHPARIDHLSIFRRSSGEIYRMVVSNREIRLHDGTVLEGGLSEGPYGQAIFADKWLLVDGANYYESDGTADGTKPVALPEDTGATLAEVKRCSLLLVKGNRVWAAGDSQLPHAVYYSQPNRYDYFKGGDEPDMTVLVGQHDGQPILVLTEIFGGILVGKPSGWWLIEGDPAEPSTFRIQRLIAGQGPIQRAYAIAGSDVWYIADDGIRILREVESNVFTTILASHQHTPLLKAGDLSDAVMAYFDDRILISYKRQMGVSTGNDFCSLADLRFQAPMEGRYAAWTRITGWNISALAVDRGVLWGGTEDGKLVRLFDGSTDLGQPITLRLWTPEYPLTETFQQKIFEGVNLEIAQTGTTPVRPVHEVAIGLARQSNEWQEAFVAYEFDSDDNWNSGTHTDTKAEDGQLKQANPRTTVSRTEDSQADFEQGTLVGTKATADGLELDTGNLDGYRIAPALDLTPVRVVGSSQVSWEAVQPRAYAWEFLVSSSGVVTSSGTTFGMKFRLNKQVRLSKVGLEKGNTGISTFHVRIYRVSDRAVVASVNNVVFSGAGWHWTALEADLAADTEYMLAFYSVDGYTRREASGSGQWVGATVDGVQREYWGRYFSVQGDAFPANEHTNQGLAFGIEYVAKQPAGASAVTVEASTDNGQTWAPLTNGGAILAPDTDVSGTSLLLRQNLAWEQGETFSPILQSFEATIVPKFPYTAEWESPEIDLAAVGRYQDSVLQVEAEEFDGEVAVYTRVSLDGGNTWSQYTRQLSGEPIAGLNQNDDLSNARLQIKVVLTTNSEGNDPSVDLVAVLFGFLGSVQRHFALRPRLRGLYIQHRITDSTPEQVTILAVGERWRPTRRLRPGEMEGSVAT